MIRTRTKIEAVLAVAFLLAISISSVFAVTRTISDTSDTVDTYIRNSNGKYWEATGANIQTAIWDLHNLTGSVYLPAGTLFLTGKIRVASHLSIIGQGMGVTIIKAANGDASTEMIVNLGSAGAKNNITISSLTIDGNTTSGNCIYISGITDFVIKNVEARNPKSNGIAVWSSKQGIITGCKSFNTNHADYENFVFTNVSDSTISNLIAYKNIGLLYDFHDCRRCVITNICGNNSAYGVKFFGDSGYWGNNNTVSNINLNNCGSGAGSALWIKRQHHSSFSNININTVTGSGVAFVIDGSDYININNFNIENVPHGMKVYSAIPTSSHININNGIIKTTTSTYGLTLSSVNNVTVSNVFIDSIATSCAYLVTSKYVIFEDCTFSQAGVCGIYGESSSLFKIHNCNFLYNINDGFDGTSGTCNNYTMSNCYFKGNAKAIDLHSSDNYFMILGCIADSGDVFDINNALSTTRRFNDSIGSYT